MDATGGVAHPRSNVFSDVENMLCVLGLWLMVKGLVSGSVWVLFLTFSYTNMQNDFCKMPNPAFADSKITHRTGSFAGNSRLGAHHSLRMSPFIFPWPETDLAKFYLPPVPVFVLPGSVSDRVPPSD